MGQRENLARRVHCSAATHTGVSVLEEGQARRTFPASHKKEDKMRKVLYCLAVFVLGAGALAAQGATVSSPDADKTDSHDRPIGGITLKLPVPITGTPGETQPPLPPPVPVLPTPEPGPVAPPIEPDFPDPPPPEPGPDFIGEEIQLKVAFLLDASGSMAGSNIATVRAEATGTISAMDEDFEFDCVAYGSQFPASAAYSQFMWGTLLPATEGNKAAAISWINGSSLNPGGGTPTYACLQRSCDIYPADLEQMFLLTDGEPNVSGSAAQILADFPDWWSKFEDCEFVAICIGGGAGAHDFMLNLAAIAGGTYVSA